MAWKPLRQKESFEEIWVAVGREKEGYLTLKEGENTPDLLTRLEHALRKLPGIFGNQSDD